MRWRAQIGLVKKPKKLSLKISCFTSPAKEQKYEYLADEVAALVGDFLAFSDNSAVLNVLTSIWKKIKMSKTCLNQEFGSIRRYRGDFKKFTNHG